MKRQNRKILLLVVPVHSVSNSELLTNITIHYLPSNTTAHLQPTNTGIYLIDDNNNYGEEILDEDIVNMVKSNEMDFIEEELVLQPKISTSKALASLDKKQMTLFDKNSRIQPTLDDWLNT
ncbi:hypothetical protein RhiirC2_795026 [Rhizophagus irregularis]|uniref:DDE-1 domain-containing protein n=1 Tax=Rhizophagus irregularis TaxID=588596 RepID=A0A2N1MCC9_9GLOM|nr:hypothetical protein RhiirC2_795026 [Rhizophagus irregularis]